MSETPRTDQAMYMVEEGPSAWVVSAAVSHRLERELSAMTAERDSLRAEVEGLRAVHAAALRLVRAPAWAGVSDEDCELEAALLAIVDNAIQGEVTK